VFPSTTIVALTSDAIYSFAWREPMYLRLLKYFADLYDYPQSIARWEEASPQLRNERFWWVMNEGWKGYGTVNPNLPLAWLSIAKRALQWNHLPCNFYPWALAILEAFDLPRYQAAYNMPPDEYEAVARDLPVVLKSLREYPQDQLAPPIDEANWGLSDQ
jgi:hypothetical protein